jgi:hypothetical protein
MTGEGRGYGRGTSAGWHHATSPLLSTTLART